MTNKLKDILSKVAKNSDKAVYSEKQYSEAFNVLDMYENRTSLSEHDKFILNRFISLINNMWETLDDGIFPDGPEKLNYALILKLLEKTSGDIDLMKEIDINASRYGAWYENDCEPSFILKKDIV